MHSLDRTTAKALAEAGYLPTSAYVAMFGDEGDERALLVPDLCDDPHDAIVLGPRIELSPIDAA